MPSAPSISTIRQLFIIARRTTHQPSGNGMRDRLIWLDLTNIINTRFSRQYTTLDLQLIASECFGANAQARDRLYLQMQGAELEAMKEYLNLIPPYLPPAS